MAPGTGPCGGSALRMHARASAGLASLSAAVHLALVPAHGWILGPIMVLMAAACLYCALRLWRGPDIAEARIVMGSALAMAALHTALLFAVGGLHTGHGGPDLIPPPQGAPTRAATADGTDLLLLLAVELAAALGAATLIARLRQQDSRSPAPVSVRTQ